MSFLGMDTDGARTHADRLAAAAKDVTGMKDALDAQIDGAEWQGPDAEYFRAAWRATASQQIGECAEQLSELADRLRAQADEQDIVSEQDGTESGPAENPSTLPAAPDGDRDDGYLNEDNPWLPDWLEKPVEQGLSGLAHAASDTIGGLFDGGMDLLTGAGRALGRNMDGMEQFRRDAEHWGGTWRDLLTGERVPTISELVAGGLLTAGSAGVGVYEAVTNQDTPFLDDRPGGIIQEGGVHVDDSPQQSPQTLQDLILQNNDLRMGNSGHDTNDYGQIGVQEVTSANGGEPVYIVQIPPTEGADLMDAPEAYGGQGNSRDWGSNLRLVAGQHNAAMDDVQAAMEAAGIPPGSNVMLVGHSQGGIVGTHLAADPAFNNTSGEPGSYNITHSFSVGSPVQTVLPAQSSTEVVNVTHGPVGLDPHLETQGGVDIRYTGDPISQLDLQGRQVTGGTLQSSNVHEVVLPGHEGRVSEGKGPLFANHDSTGPRNDPNGGYAGTVGRSTQSDPTLSALQHDLNGVYLGPGTVVSRTTVVDVGRGEP